MATPDLARYVLERLAEGGAQTKSHLVASFPEKYAAEADAAFEYLRKRKAIILIDKDDDPEDPHARWAISTKLLLGRLAELA